MPGSSGQRADTEVDPYCKGGALSPPWPDKSGDYNILLTEPNLDANLKKIWTLIPDKERK